MILDAPRDTNGPGLVHPERLAAGNAIDVPTRRRDPWSEFWLRWICRGFFIALGLAALVRIAAP